MSRSAKDLRVRLILEDNASATFVRIGQSAQQAATQISTAGKTAAAGLSQVDAEAERVAVSTAKANTSVQNMGRGFTVLKGALTGAAATTFLGFLQEATALGNESAAVQVRLEQSVQNTGKSYDQYAVALQNAQNRAVALAQDDEDAANALATLTEETGSATKAMDLLGLSLDIAAAKHLSLETAATLVGRVAQGNTGLLARYAITVDKNATSTEALGELQKRYAGQAQAYAETTAGGAAKIGIAFENQLEAIGNATGPLQTYIALLPGLSQGWSLAGAAMGGAGTILGKIIGPTAAAGEAATTAGGAAAGFAGALEAATPLLAGLGVAAAAAAPLIIATAVAIERGNEASANWNTTLDANARFLNNVGLAAGDADPVLQSLIDAFTKWDSTVTVTQGKTTVGIRDLSDEFRGLNKDGVEALEAIVRHYMDLEGTTADETVLNHLQEIGTALVAINQDMGDRRYDNVEVVRAMGQEVDAANHLSDAYLEIKQAQRESADTQAVIKGIDGQTDRLNAQADAYYRVVDAATQAGQASGAGFLGIPANDLFNPNVDYCDVKRGIADYGTELDDKNRKEEQAKAEADALAQTYRSQLIPAIGGVSDELRATVGPAADVFDVLTQIGRTGGPIGAIAADLAHTTSALDDAVGTLDQVTSLGSGIGSATSLVDSLIGTPEDRQRTAEDLANIESQYGAQVQQIERDGTKALHDLEAQHTKDVRSNAAEREQIERDLQQKLKDLDQQRLQDAQAIEQSLTQLAAQRNDIEQQAQSDLAQAATQYNATVRDNNQQIARARSDLADQVKQAAADWREVARQSVADIAQVKEDLKDALSTENTDFGRRMEDIQTDRDRLSRDLQQNLSDPNVSQERKQQLLQDYYDKIADLDTEQARLEEDHQQAISDAKKAARDKEKQLEKDREDAQQAYHDKVDGLESATASKIKGLQDAQTKALADYNTTRAGIHSQEMQDLQDVEDKRAQVLADAATKAHDLDSEERTIRNTAAREREQNARDSAQIEEQYARQSAGTRRDEEKALRDAYVQYQDDMATARENSQSRLDAMLADGEISQGDYNTILENGRKLQATNARLEADRAGIIADMLPDVTELAAQEERRAAALSKMNPDAQKAVLLLQDQKVAADLATIASAELAVATGKLNRKVATQIEIDYYNNSDQRVKDLIDTYYPEIGKGAKGQVDVTVDPAAQTALDTTQTQIDTIGEGATATLDADATPLSTSLDNANKAGEDFAATVYTTQLSADRSQFDTVKSGLEADLRDEWGRIIWATKLGIVRASDFDTTLTHAKSDLAAFTQTAYVVKLSGDYTYAGETGAAAGGHVTNSLYSAIEGASNLGEAFDGTVYTARLEAENATADGITGAATDLGMVIKEPYEAKIGVEETATWDQDIRTITENLTDLILGSSGDGYRVKIGVDDSELAKELQFLANELDGETLANAIIKIKTRTTASPDPLDGPVPPPTTGGNRRGPQAGASGLRVGSKTRGGAGGWETILAGEHEPEYLLVPPGTMVLSGSATASAMAHAGVQGYAKGGRVGGGGGGGGAVSAENFTSWQSWLNAQTPDIQAVLKEYKPGSTRGPLSHAQKIGLMTGDYVLLSSGEVVEKARGKDRKKAYHGYTSQPLTGVDRTNNTTGGEDDTTTSPPPPPTTVPPPPPPPLVTTPPTPTQPNEPVPFPTSPLPSRPDLIAGEVPLTEALAASGGLGQLIAQAAAGRGNTVGVGNGGVEPRTTDGLAAALHRLEGQIEKLATAVTQIQSDQNQPFRNYGTLYLQSGPNIGDAVKAARQSATALRV